MLNQNKIFRMRYNLSYIAGVDTSTIKQVPFAAAVVGIDTYDVKQHSCKLYPQLYTCAATMGSTFPSRIGNSGACVVSGKHFAEK